MDEVGIGSDMGDEKKFGDEEEFKDGGFGEDQFRVEDVIEEKEEDQYQGNYQEQESPDFLIDRFSGEEWEAMLEKFSTLQKLASTPGVAAAGPIVISSADSKAIAQNYFNLHVRITGAIDHCGPLSFQHIWHQECQDKDVSFRFKDIIAAKIPVFFVGAGYSIGGKTYFVMMSNPTNRSASLPPPAPGVRTIQVISHRESSRGSQFR